MPEVVELREVMDRRDVVHRAVQALASGDLAALPSEAGYVLAGAALIEGVGQRLSSGGGTLTLLLRNADECADFLPQLPSVGMRLAQRCWPGPMVLRSSANAAEGFVAALPDQNRSQLIAGGQISTRVSSHPILSEIARLSRGPLLVREIESPTKKTDFSVAPWSLSALVVQDQSSRSDTASRSAAENQPSIVSVNAVGEWTTERLGATPEAKLQAAASQVILFCCTGNTCRSPMAEVLCRHLLCERLRCSPAELTQHGYLIASAGLAADYGSPASRESVEIMQRRGLDLKSHASQPLTDRLIEQVDRCYTMTNSHRMAILESHPELADRVQVLSRDGRDIADPIGGTINSYAACAASIEHQIRQVLDEIT